MVIEERTIGDVTIFDVRGRITLGEGDQLLKDRAWQWLESGGRKLVLNLRNVPYIDSSGNGELVRTYTVVSRRRGKMVLLHLTKRIQDLLAITKLLTVYETSDDEVEALASFHESRRTSVCPVCRHHAAFASGHQAVEICVNCSTQFSVHYAENETGGAWFVDSIRVPTYEGEEIHIRSSWPWTISVSGRLDLFSVDALEEAWQAVPRPRKIVVELGPECRTVTNRAFAALAALCAPEVDGGRTAAEGWRTGPRDTAPERALL